MSHKTPIQDLTDMTFRKGRESREVVRHELRANRYVGGEVSYRTNGGLKVRSQNYVNFYRWFLRPGKGKLTISIPTTLPIPPDDRRFAFAAQVFTHKTRTRKGTVRMRMSRRTRP